MFGRSIPQSQLGGSAARDVFSKSGIKIMSYFHCPIRLGLLHMINSTCSDTRDIIISSILFGENWGECLVIACGKLEKVGETH